MISRLLELREQRGQLCARCDAQREAFAATHGAPLARVCSAVDSARAGVDWIKHHPGVVGLVAALLVIRRPKRLWRFGLRAFGLWRGLRVLRILATSTTVAPAPRR
jgi:hypothetical protein